MQGNPFCLQPCYLSAVQHALPRLYHLDGAEAPLCPPASASADSVTTNTGSSAAVDATMPAADSEQQHLHVCFSQLSVQNTTPGCLPAPDAASEPAPPVYWYYLQLHTAQGGLVCSFPVVLTPQEQLLQWQAQQSAAAPADPSKKAGSKAGKGSKLDVAEQRKAWYQEVTHWLQSKHASSHTNLH